MVMKPLLAGMALLALAGCAATATSPAPTRVSEAALKPVHRDLLDLPAPRNKVYVAVYDFPDKTGQFKPNDNGQTLSRAVTQGATAMLIDTLRSAGRGNWFSVVERENLDQLLRERQIITDMRAAYANSNDAAPALPPLRFAGIILAGGIVGYDTNRLTGGAGARFLGVGADTEYREDVITVYLRAVSTQTGEVLHSVQATKRVISYGAGADLFRFVSFKKLLEVESGFTTNEPATIALSQALDLAVYAIVIEGAERGVWSFEDPDALPRLRAHYLENYGTQPLAVPAAQPSVSARPPGQG